MRRLAILLLSASSVVLGADVRYAWLPFSNNIPGVAQTQAETTQYGINVFLQSDNPSITEFEVTVVVKSSSGEVRVLNGNAQRQGKAAGVQYSSMCSMWVDSSPDFEVLAIEAKAVTAAKSTRPTAGKQYTSDGTGSSN